MIYVFRSSYRWNSMSPVSKPRFCSKQVETVRGMNDIYGVTMAKHSHIVKTATTLSKAYGFEEISTPIVEHISTFNRTLGELSDVVSKEMYTLTSKSDHVLALRPENTAGIVRAVLTNKDLFRNHTMQFYYHGPMFRYERPQKGRHRQFHQFGIESLGKLSVINDVECIQLATSILEDLGLWDNCRLELNSLGDSESRMAYKEVLSYYLKDHYASLSSLSKTRLDRGSVLRILDSKEAEDQMIIRSAPKLVDHLNAKSSERFLELQNLLEAAGIEFVINHHLVRGLDYYNDTCFEIVSKELKSTILAGGRYDNLSVTMGGQPIPGIGWAAGLERLTLLVKDEAVKPPRPVFFAILHENTSYKYDILKASFKFSKQLRDKGILTIIGQAPDLTKQLKLANKHNASLFVIIGENEIKTNTYKVKDMDKKEQVEITSDNIISYIMNNTAKNISQ